MTARETTTSSLPWQNIAAFLAASSQGVFLVALPFAVKGLGGGVEEVGRTVSLSFVAYVVLSITVVPVIDRFNAKRTIQISSIVTTLGLAAVALPTWLAVTGRDVSHPLGLVTAAVIVSGGSMALFWPPMGGWVAGAFAGKELNRRVSRYNASWSSGLVVSPLVGSYLTEMSQPLALFVATGLMFLSLLAVTVARGSAGRAGCVENATEDFLADAEGAILARFRLMARVSLVGGFVCVGMLRSVTALLFTDELGLSESDYGWAITTMCTAGFLIYVATGRSHAWHLSLPYFFGAQLLLFVGMGLMAISSSLWLLIGAGLLVGICQAFGTVSHMIYNLSGETKRLRAMTIHEILVSVGS